MNRARWVSLCFFAGLLHGLEQVLGFMCARDGKLAIEDEERNAGDAHGPGLAVGLSHLGVQPSVLQGLGDACLVDASLSGHLRQ